MSQDESKKPVEPVKVSDRRSFTSEGDRRTPDQPKSEVAGPRVAAPPPTAPPEDSSGAPGAIDFDSFVRYLAQVALHQMTPPRDAGAEEASAGLEEARQTIEILAMLKSKTRGNLTPNEAKSLDDLLYHLKVEFSRRALAERR
jgi:uncharacterized protein DUF1844